MEKIQELILQKAPNGWVTASMIAKSIGITHMQRKAPWLDKEPVGYGRKILKDLEALCLTRLFEKRIKPNMRFRRSNGVANNCFNLTPSVQVKQMLNKEKAMETADDELLKRLGV